MLQSISADQLEKGHGRGKNCVTMSLKTRKDVVKNA